MIRHERDSPRTPSRCSEIEEDRPSHSPFSYIPKDVQRPVRRRDRGRCAEYGSIEGFGYDHIIPFAKGGGNKKGTYNYSASNAIDENDKIP
jgi:hypothetical protein